MGTWSDKFSVSWKIKKIVNLFSNSFCARNCQEPNELGCVIKRTDRNGNLLPKALSVRLSDSSFSLELAVGASVATFFLKLFQTEEPVVCFKCLVGGIHTPCFMVLLHHCVTSSVFKIFPEAVLTFHEGNPQSLVRRRFWRCFWGFNFSHSVLSQWGDTKDHFVKFSFSIDHQVVNRKTFRSRWKVLSAVWNKSHHCTWLNTYPFLYKENSH